MVKSTRFGLSMLLLALSSLYFLASGIHGAIHQSWDFVPVYSGARCLLRGCNPYNSDQLSAAYASAGGPESIVAQAGGWADESELYPPSTFAALAPLGILPFPVALGFWSLLNGTLFLTAVLLVFKLCPQRRRWLATAFACFFLINGIEMVKDGQASAFAVSTLAIGAFLFLRRRRLLPAALLLMLSVAVKPQIGGLVVLYFLTDKAVRRHAVLAISGALALLLIGSLVLSARRESRNWAGDMRSNVASSMAPGQVNDPAFPAAGQVQLNAITSVLLPDRRTSFAIAFSIFFVLMFAWATVSLPHHPDSPLASIALGALVALSLLPVYHRHPDASVLLLSIPSVLKLIEWRRGFGAVVAAFTFLASASIPSFINGYLTAHVPAVRDAFLQNKFLLLLVLDNAADLPAKFQHLAQNKLQFILIFRQENLALLMLSCLYVLAAFAIRFQHRTVQFKTVPPLRQPALPGQTIHPSSFFVTNSLSSAGLA